MDRQLLGIIAGVLFLVAMIYAYFNTEAAKARRALKETPIKRIAELAVGEIAKVVGRARPAGKALTAPFSGRRCVLYEIELRESNTRRGAMVPWVVLAKERKQVDFTVEDPSGAILVRSDQDVRVDAKIDVQLASGILRDPTPRLQAFLDRHGIAADGLVFNRSLEYVESVFEVGEPIGVLGTVADEASDEDGPRLGLRGAPNQPLVVSDSRAVTERADLSTVAAEPELPREPRRKRKRKRATADAAAADPPSAAEEESDSTDGATAKAGAGASTD